jgi:hypothetical protein
MKKEPLVIVPGRLYTSEEVADYLRVEVATLHVWEATQRYPLFAAKHPHGKLLYPGEAILAFVNSPHQKAASYTPRTRRLPKPKSHARKRRSAK